jgi:hypothetical protein
MTLLKTILRIELLFGLGFFAGCAFSGLLIGMKGG